MKRSFELLFGAHHRLGFSIGFNREHPNACRLLLEFSKLSAKMQIFLLKLTKMSGQLGFRLMTANRIGQALQVHVGANADEKHRPVVLKRPVRFEHLGFRDGGRNRADFPGRVSDRPSLRFLFQIVERRLQIEAGFLHGFALRTLQDFFFSCGESIPIGHHILGFGDHGFRGGGKRDGYKGNGGRHRES